ncbi:hypothetical protein VPNG_00810 [Cytospora leucostoma]|uniref:Uncharacterized protein n=1 Tax=Cytospora leucostoma TaxID=1230097 RepID=A0A423XMX6_9PEZI|nr:hypothetical protein VPNG_00810 [Cytospora leucostoma]
MRQAIRSNARWLAFRAGQAQGFHHTSRACLISSPPSAPATKQASSNQSRPTSQQPRRDDTKASAEKKVDEAIPPRRKTMAELDEELRLKLEGMSGDGGSAGVEYENGKAEGLKRGVKSNMFRVI